MSLQPQGIAENLQPGDDAYKVQLEIFEGPLDLLLHLIRQQEIDIYDIPVSSITQQYLDYVQMMRQLNITVAGEFLVMASTLIYLKSSMLLPLEPDSTEDDYEGDPRQELVEQLLEYEKYKQAAHLLHEKESMELAVWTRGEKEFELDEKEAVAVGLFDVIQAFHQIVQRYQDQIVLEIERDPVTLEEKIDEIRRLLKARRRFLFSIFFERKLSRIHLGVTLMALLELVRLGEIRLFQKGIFEDIQIVAC
jgi:segregation and condensation protein A